MKLQNQVLSALADGRTAFGTFIQLNSAETCEIAARSGLDFVIIDMEHGSFGIESAVNMIRAAESSGAAAFVRIAECSRSTVLKVLDAGAVGILVPNVESDEQLREVISATRYAPDGTRGSCPCVRSTDHGLREWSESTRWAAQNIMVIALVETRAGVDNFDAIIKVEGLSAVGVGQFDLSMSMGYEGQHDHPDVVAKQGELVSLARERGVDVLAVVFDSELEAITEGVARWKRLGARLVAVSGDRFALVSAFKSFAKAMLIKVHEHRG